METKEHRPIVLQDDCAVSDSPKSGNTESVPEGSKITIIELGTVTGSTKSGGYPYVQDNFTALGRGT